MSSQDFQKSPLQPLPDSGWAVVQNRAAGEPAHAWVSLPGSTSISAASGAADATALLQRAKSAGLTPREIPGTWLALPTGMDLQVHLRHPGQPNKETLQGGLESALYGGFDTIVTMPNTNPFLDSPEALHRAIEAARYTASRYPVRIAFTASATVGMQGTEPAPIEALARAGAVAITDDGWGVKTSEAQDGVFAACARAGLLFQQHAEMPGHKGVATDSAFQRSEQLPEYPRGAESEMVKRDIALLRKRPGARYHILHISTRETLDEIRKAKSEGLAVTAEVTPHHLFFANDQIPPESNPLSTAFKFNPPIFAPEDRAALRAALRDGTIDCVSTDHAPHETELKKKGWRLAPFGTRGMETALPALLTLVHEGELSLARLVEVFSSAPRRVLGRSEYSRATGLLFVDPHAAYRVDEKELPGISRNSCFVGASLHGRIELRAEPGKLYARAN
jgi:dihydroorotase